MSCPNPELLAATVDGRLDPARRAAVLDHAALCDECRHALLIIQASGPARPAARLAPWIPWAAAAAVVLSIAGYLLFGRETPSREEPVPTTRAGTPKREERPEPVRPELPPPVPVPAPIPPKPEEPRKPPAPPAIVEPTPAPKPIPEPPVKPEEPAPAKPAPTPEPPRPTTVAVVATLDRIEGEVFVGKAAAKAGQPIRHGESVETRGARSWALVSYPDKTRLELEGETFVREFLDREATKGRRLFVEKGAVKGDVSKQPAGQPMVFDTPHGEARVLGTTLRIQVDLDPKKGTRLEVEEGKVELRNPAGKSALVESGQFAVASAGASPSAKRLPKEEVLLALDFEDGRKPAPISRGTLERGPDRRLCWAGEPDGGGSGFALGGDPDGLFACAGDEVLSFDYWVDAQASAISLTLWNRTRKHSHEGAILKVVPGKWTRVSVKLAELDPAMPMKDGDWAVSLILRATGSAPRRFFVDNVTLTRSRSLKPRPVETK